MSSPLITTKLRAPRPRPDLVRRDRLHALLEQGSRSRLTLLSAPAGFGKTTLLVDWLAARRPAGRGVAWVSLDRTDNEAAAFWAHLVAALRDAGAGLGEDPPGAPGQRPDRRTTIALLNALAELPGELDLILDDLHLVEDAALLEEFAFFVDHLPDGIHLLVSTRADPPLPLARYRARGELAEIRAADLRFRPEEAASYFAGAARLQLDAADVARLEERTEGWIAALQLAALSMRGRGDVSAFVANFAGSDRYVVDYLVEEVLRRQPEDVRRFLYATSILGRFCGELCDAVLGARGSAAVIEMLEQQNLFVVALDERRQWYRYHHLFADVLQAHMPEVERDRLPARHRAASLWLEAHGERDEAIRHALAAPDFELAAQLIERAAPEMRRRRRDAVLRAAIEALPDALVRSRPRLSIELVGPLLQAGMTAGIEERLDEAEARLRQMGEGPLRDHLAAIELFRSGLAQIRGDMDAALAHATRVFEVAPPDAHLERAGAAGFLAIVAWSKGDLEPASRHWAECTNGLLQIGFVADALGTLYARGQIAIARGRLDDAQLLLEQGLALAGERQAYPLPGSADLEVGLAQVALERNDLAGAHRHLALSESASLAGMPQYPSRKLLVAARLAWAEGDAGEAFAQLDEAARLDVSDFFPVLRPIPAVRARLSLARGDRPAAERWLRDSGPGAATPLDYAHEYEHLTLSRLLLAQGETAQARDLLERLLAAARAGGRDGTLVEIEMLRALAAEAAGDHPGAQAALRRSLELAEAQGQARVFLDEGEAVAGLLRAAARSSGATAYGRRLLAAAAPPQPPRPADHPDLLEPLSERELDVLRLLRGELSGPEIAGELRVSLNTLRTHTKNLYEKLSVNSRRAAVRRAEELGLLRSGRRD